MRPTADDAVLVGPWGWIGWLLFSLALGALGILWRSSGPTQLRALNRALSEARKLIEDMEKRERAMLRRNRELDQQHRELHEKYLDLNGRFSELNVANAKLGDLYADLKKELKEERELREQQFLELMRAKAKTGDL